MSDTTLLACRGCCCGAPGKHPGVDHDALLARLRAIEPDLMVTLCLGPCRRSNVVVAVRDTGEQTWFGGVLDHTAVDEVRAWLGEPDPARLPARAFTPTPVATARVAQLVAVHAALGARH